MNAHETLPTRLKSYIRQEKIHISYLNLKNVLGFLYIKNIGINKNMNLYKIRFAIAHETGHYFYGHQNRSYLLWKFFKNYDEKKADEYAIENLLPEKELLEEFEKYEWDLCVLEKIFWVEMEIIGKFLTKILWKKYLKKSYDL